MFKFLLRNTVATVCMFVFVASASASYGLYAVEGENMTFHFEYETYVGQTIEGQMAIRNYGDADMTVDVEAVDASENYKTSFSLESVSHDKNIVGAWIVFDQNTVTVDAGETVLLDFTLQMPADVLPGEYAGGLVVYAHKDDSAVAGSGLSIVSQQALRVYVNVLEGQPENFLSAALSQDDLDGKSPITVNDGYLYLLMLMLVLNLALIMYFVYTQQRVNAALLHHLPRDKKKK